MGTGSLYQLIQPLALLTQPLALLTQPLALLTQPLACWPSHLLVDPVSTGMQWWEPLGACLYNLLCVYAISVSTAEVDCRCKLIVGVDCPSRSVDRGVFGSPDSCSRIIAFMRLFHQANSQVVLNWPSKWRVQCKLIALLPWLGYSAIVSVAKVPELTSSEQMFHQMFTFSTHHFTWLSASQSLRHL